VPYPNQDINSNSRDFTDAPRRNDPKILPTRHYKKQRGALWLAYGSCLGFIGLEMNENGSMQQEN
jgi:hypothetical protein